MVLPSYSLQKSERDITPHLAVAIIASAVLLTFWPLCGFEFVSWDDVPFIAKNPWFVNASFVGLLHYWATPFYTMYAPLTTSAWMLLAMAGRSDMPDANGIVLNPYLFHTVNLLVHLGAALLVLDVLRRLLKSNWGAMAGALIFALHPVQVETVGWISGLKDLLGGALSFAAIAMYIAAVSPTAPKRGKLLYAGGVAVFILAMLAKPSAMTTAAVVIAIDRLLLRRPWKTVAVWAIPWLLLAAGCALLARHVQPVDDAPLAPIWGRPLLVGQSLAFYLGKIIWPAKLGIDYGMNPEAVWKTTAVAWAWIVPTLVLTAAGLARRRSRVPLAAGAIFLLATVHTLGLVGFDFQRISTTADHYLYVSMLGVALLIGWLVTSLPRVVGVTAVAIVAATLGVRSFMQVQTWRDSQTLLEHGLTVNPDSWAIRTSLAVLAVGRHDYALAIQHSEAAIHLEPRYVRPYITLGAARASLGDLPGATEAYRRAVEIEERSEFLTNLGGILAEQGQTDEARPLLQRAVLLDPHNAKAHLNLGTLHLLSGDPPTAARLLRRAVELAPHDAKAHFNFGVALIELGDRVAGASHLQTAYRLQPDLPRLRESMISLGIRPHVTGR